MDDFSSYDGGKENASICQNVSGMKAAFQFFCQPAWNPSCTG